MLEEIKIAAVIVTFNRCELLYQNLKSLSEQGTMAYFIIDNNSTDDTRLIVERFRNEVEDRVVYFNTGENLGGAGGFALGCQKALNDKVKYTHLWLSDDDVTFSNGCLNELSKFFDNKTILQPMRYNTSGINCEASATKVDLDTIFIFNHKRDSVKGSMYEHTSQPFDLQNIPFEGPLIPREVFELIGIPDKRYFIFSDDLDFSLKALKAGFEIKCVPNAKMVRLRPVEPNYIPKDWKSYFVYRNFFHIQKSFGNNFFVRNRPYFLAVLLFFYCFFTANFKGCLIIKDALKDGMSKEFPVNKKYIP